MGDKNFMGGLLGGMAQGLQQQQELSLRKGLQEAHITLLKQQAKVQEQKYKTADLLSQMQQQYLGNSGAGGGTAGGGAAGATGAPDDGVGLNSQYAKENMFYRILSGGGSLPAPNLRPTVTKLADGRILTSLNGKVISVMQGPVEMKQIQTAGPGGVPGVTNIQPQFMQPGGGALAPGGASPVQPGLGATPPQLQQPGAGDPMWHPTGVRPMGYKPVEDPTGGQRQTVVGTVPLPGEDYSDKPPGAKISDAGRFNMVMQADNRIKEVNTMLFPEGPAGKINRTLIFKASAPGGGIGEGSQLFSKMYQVVDSALRLETGAQANESEIKIKMGEYWPSWKDTDATVRQKIKDLNEYANGAVELSDPTGQIREMRQKGTATTVRVKAPPAVVKGTAGSKTADEYLKKLFSPRAQ